MLDIQVEQRQIDPKTIELRWTRDGRMYREQFCDRGSPGEVQAMVTERITELKELQPHRRQKGEPCRH
jgi:hypothetical protein